MKKGILGWNYLSLGISILSTLICLSLLRVIFLSYNWSYFRDLPFMDIFLSMIYGVRFDASVLFLVYLPGIFLAGFFLVVKGKKTGDRGKSSPTNMWPVSSRISRYSFTLFVLLASFALISFNVSDIEHFHFIKRRSTLELFLNPSDFKALALPMIWENIWLTLFGLLMCVVPWVCIKVVEVARARGCVRFSRFSRFSRNGHILVWLFLLIFAGFCIRGGLQKRPLTNAHANSFTSDPMLVALSLNSVFSLVHSRHGVYLQERSFFSDIGRVIKSLREYQFDSIVPDSRGNTPRRDNVVIIVMESMGSLFLERGSQKSRVPFFESLAESGTLYRNGFANGGETALSVLSVLGGLPQGEMRSSLPTSNYASTSVAGLGVILKKYGYSTSFFHGGNPALFYFDVMAKKMGFDSFYSLNTFPHGRDSADYDGVWGIYDIPFFEYAANILDTTPEPFAGFLLSLSNHTPFTIPRGYSSQLAGEKYDSVDRTAIYADTALKNFFLRSMKKPWFARTIFFITGDHPPHGKENDPFWQDELTWRMVPMAVVHGADWLKNREPLEKVIFAGQNNRSTLKGGGLGVSNRVVQHVDILPSVLDFLDLPNRERRLITTFGRSFFNTSIPGVAFLSDTNHLELVTRTTLSKLKHKSQECDATTQNIPQGVFVESDLPAVDADFKLGGIKKIDVAAALLCKYAQYYNYGLIHNRLGEW